jgi:hypothetical protein
MKKLCRLLAAGFSDRWCMKKRGRLAMVRDHDKADALSKGGGG